MSKSKIFIKRNIYEIERSPFFELSSKKKLASLLLVDLSLLDLKSSNVHLKYKKYTEQSSTRLIQEPYGELLGIQRRILKLLSRIETPQYLHSAIKKKSYKTNAEAHLDGENIFKIDIVKFYCSVKFEAVYKFFLKEFSCSIDIATILAKLCTVETDEYGVHLPTGSCLSPIFSYLVCRNMFDSIYEICSQRNCNFTLYIDDITVSGKNATASLMYIISREISKHGFSTHKYKSYKNQPATVTGLIIENGRLSLPHIRAKIIRSSEETLTLTTDAKLKAKILASLIGRLSEAEHIDPSYKIKRQNTLSKYKIEWKMITEDRVLKAQIKSKKIHTISNRSKSIDDIVLVPSF